MANTVGSFADGVGNKIDAIQWDGDAVGTLPNIVLWTKKASYLASRSVLRIQTSSNLQNVGVGDWLVMDSHREDQVFPMTNSQFAATYAASTP